MVLERSVTVCLFLSSEQGGVPTPIIRMGVRRKIHRGEGKKFCKCFFSKALKVRRLGVYGA